MVLIVFVVQSLLMNEIQITPKEVKTEKMPLAAMPLLSLLSAAIYGLFESSVIVVLPLYGLRNNFSSDQVSYFLASFVTGGIVILYIVGNIADKISKYRLLLLISAVLGLFFLFPALLMDFGFLLVVFFFIGGIVPAFYTVGLNYTVENVEKRFMAQANGYFVMMYGAGTIMGPLLGVLLVDFNRQYAYWLFSSALCLCFFLLFRFYSSGKAR
jgi:MFS family permease